MRSRNLRVRTKIVALLLSLFALWAFAAYVTVQDGLNLLWVGTLDQQIGRPTDSVIDALQVERRLSVIYLATDAAPDLAALQTQRGQTDQALAHFRHAVGTASAHFAEDEPTSARVQELSHLLDGLDQTRQQITARAIDRETAALGFTSIVDAGFRIFGTLSTLDDQDIARQGRSVVALNRAREVLAQEDVLLSGILAAGRFSGDEPSLFAQLVGAQRFQFAEATAGLSPDEVARYQAIVAGPDFSRVQAIEDQVIARAGNGVKPPVTAAAWQAAVTPLSAAYKQFVVQATDDTVAKASPVALAVIIRLCLAGGLGLLAVIASAIISFTTARSLQRELTKLRNAAWDLARQRLPNVVERLRAGDEVDVATEAPPLDFGPGEIGDVGRAFNAVQETAVRAAVEQAEIRKSVRDVFLSLARRTQALVHRQLRLLDTMERRETSPEELADLFKVDHLATRMRRNAENLIVLSGAVPGRGWRQSVPMVDVVRGALAEVEDYTRVTVLPVGSAGLVGRAVGDIIHLLAELIENAVSFSPPYTTVQVSGQLVANGFVVEIEDRGLGMTELDLAAANEQIRNPPEFTLSGTARLGLYVVSRLAKRHGVRVSLKDSPYGGTTAVVLIPPSLVSEDPEERDRPAIGAGTRSAITAAPVPAGTEPNGYAGHGQEAAGYPAVGYEVGGRAWSLGTADELTVLDGDHAGDPTSGDPVSGDLASAGNGRRRLATPGPSADPGTAGIDGHPDGAGTDGHSGAAGTDGFSAGIGVPETADNRGADPWVPPVVPMAPATSWSPANRSSRALSSPADEQAEPDRQTPSGLPVRVRQASLAAPLRAEPVAPAVPAPAAAPAARPPEEIRNLMASYQSGTRRGRHEATLATKSPDVTGPAPAAAAEPAGDDDPRVTGPHA